MQINKIPQMFSSVTQNIGKTILNKNSKTGDILRKTNKFIQGEGYNPGRGAYYVLMSACVVGPRLLRARDEDEKREILTRDVITIATLLFAMKALQSGMCMVAQKKSGLPLLHDNVKGKNLGKRILGYFNPEGGILPFRSDEVLARYSRFQDKESFVKCLKTIDKDGGKISKVFNLESKKGKRPMYDAAKMLFGDNFTEKTNTELIKSVENLASDEAKKGLEQLIGSKTLNIENGIEEGILNNKDNPITKYARNISATFNTISLGITAGFLGFGISKINELLTTKKHLNKPQAKPVMQKDNMPTGIKPLLLYSSSSKNSNNPYSNFTKMA